VSAVNGVVTLAGEVPSWAARTAAAEAAHRVAGVRDVANEIEVRLGGLELPDVEIAHAARQALERDVFVIAEHVNTTVAHGVLTLAGRVPTMAQREDAERAVERLRGVRRVENRIEVGPDVEAGDVEEGIQAALARQATREAAHLQLSVHDGHVVVEGRLRSAAERRAVLGAVKGTRGVVTVDDQLVVEPT